MSNSLKIYIFKICSLIYANPVCREMITNTKFINQIYFYLFQIKFLSKGARSEGLSAQTLRIPHCPPPCMLSDFVNVTKQNIPENWDKECQL